MSCPREYHVYVPPKDKCTHNDCNIPSTMRSKHRNRVYKPFDPKMYYPHRINSEKKYDRLDYSSYTPFTYNRKWEEKHYYGDDHPIGFPNFNQFEKERTQGIIKLYKNDFEVLQNGQLRVIHPLLRGQNGFVLFKLNDCPDCQDTKTMWSAVAMSTKMMNEFICSSHNTATVCTGAVPGLMYIRKDGMLVDFRGKVNRESLLHFVNRAYKFY